MDRRQSIKAVARNYAQASMPPYLRHLHRHLEEPVGGVRRTFPISPIRQVPLAPDRVDALDPVRVQVRRPCDLRHAIHELNPRCELRFRVRKAPAK